MVCASSAGALPALAITYNHRSEAMYRAIEKEPRNPYVARALSTGLENVRMLSSKTPTSVREILCNLHNAYHDGTGETWFSLLDVAEDLMLQWEQKSSHSGLNTRNSQYDSLLEKFIFKERQAQSVSWNESMNYFKVTSVLNNHLNRFQIKESVRSWCNSHMNFADFKINNRPFCMS